MKGSDKIVCLQTYKDASFKEFLDDCKKSLQEQAKLSVISDAEGTLLKLKKLHKIMNWKNEYKSKSKIDLFCDSKIMIDDTIRIPIEKYNRMMFLYQFIEKEIKND